MRKFLSAMACVCATGAFAASGSRVTFMPENNLNLQDDIFAKSANLTEGKFNEVIDNVLSFYAPLAASHGGTLTAGHNWTDGTVNAYAERTGNQWKVQMFGGLARRSEISPDGFALVMCHELGHHFGGFAFYEGDWAAAEGQSDYFATQVCARKIWAKTEAENAGFRTTVSSVAKTKCDQAWSKQEDRDICYRTAVASQTLGNLLAALGGSPMPKYDSPDTSKVSATNTDHPEAQCRLDTYLNGALCTATFDDKVIPGVDNASGQESLDAEKEAAKYSCTEAGHYKAGLRPACWYLSRLTENAVD